MKTITEQSVSTTIQHIQSVQKNFEIIFKELINRAKHHDKSKLEEPELSGFATMYKDKQNIKYGTDEYYLMLQRNTNTLDTHYKNNSHHPEHYKNSINDMDLLDIIEMLIDWYSSTIINKLDVIETTKHNINRFKIDTQLENILFNTLNRYLTKD